MIRLIFFSLFFFLSSYCLTQSLTITQIENLVFRDVKNFKDNDSLIIFSLNCTDTSNKNKIIIIFHDNYLVQLYEVTLPQTKDITINVIKSDTCFYDNRGIVETENLSAGFFCEETIKIKKKCIEYGDDDMVPVFESIVFENGDLWEKERYIINGRVIQIKTIYSHLRHSSCEVKKIKYLIR